MLYIFWKMLWISSFIPQKGQKCSMLPVDLFDPLYGVRGEGWVDGDSGDGTAAQVTDHVIDGLELLLQIVGVPAPRLGSLRGVISDRFPAYTTGKKNSKGFWDKLIQKKCQHVVFINEITWMRGKSNCFKY